MLKLNEEENIEIENLLPSKKSKAVQTFESLFHKDYFNTTKIRIPKILNNAFKNHSQNGYKHIQGKLANIHKDKDVAIEMVKWFISFFKTKEIISYENRLHRYNDYFVNTNTACKIINRDILNSIFGRKSATFILKFCLETKIIVKVHDYYAGVNSNGYKLTDKYYNSKFEFYTFKTDICKEKYYNSKKQIFEKKCNNEQNGELYLTEVKNFLNIEMPSVEKVEELYKTFAKKHYVDCKGRLVTTKKQMEYVLYNSKRQKDLTPKLYIKTFLDKYNATDFIIVEEVVKHYEYTKDVFPSYSRTSGGRITTKVNLQPKEIRNIIDIKQEQTQLDYKALHPNICLKVYGAQSEQAEINGDIHTYFSKHGNITRAEAKIEGLSFLNKREYLMRKSPLFDCYEKLMPQCLENILRDKFKFKYDGSYTYRTLVDIEVRMMNTVIKRIRKEIDDDIVILNVYDELIVPMKYKKEIKYIMNKVAEEYKIKTYVE